MNSQNDSSSAERNDGAGSRPQEPPPKLKVQPIVQILERSVEDFRLEFEPSEIRRTVGEAVRTWPGSLDLRWWKWLVEAGESLDLRIAVVECSLADAIRLAAEGMHLAAFLPGQEQPWLSVEKVRRGKIRVFQPGARKPVRWIGHAALKRLLCNAVDESDVLRCVTVEPALTCDAEHHERELRSGRELKPLARTLLVLRAEWSDIWVVLVFALLSGILALATPMAVQTMVSLVAFGHFLQPVIVLSLMLLALMVFWASLRIWEVYILEILQRRLFARVAHDLSYRLPRVRQEALDGSYGPELTNRFFDVLTLQKVTAQFLLDAVDIAMVSIIGMAVLAVYHPLLLGLDLMLLSSIAFVIFGLGIGGVRTSIQESKYKYYTAAWLEEITRCPLTFKLDNASEFVAEKAEHHVSGYLESRRLHFRVLFRQIAFALTLHAMAGSVLLGVGGWLVIRGQLTLGQLVAAEMIVAIVVNAFTKMGKHLEAYYDLMAGIDKLGLLFDLPLESQEGLMRLPDNRPAAMEARNVSFHYDPSREILREQCFTIRSGERVAITGPAGCGKSTLADILYGLRQPSQGQVLLDRHDMRDVRPDVWRRHVMLLRAPEVFQGTVTENVHLQHPDIDVRSVRAACEQLGLLEANVLHDGLETELSSTGAPLSDSQVRRLALARALVHRPRLLIIDGLLDPLPEDILEPVLDQLFDPSQPWTLAVISSRSSILRRCDRRISIVSADKKNVPVKLQSSTE